MRTENKGGRSEERLILDLLDSRTGGRVTDLAAQSELVREDIEVLGLLAGALPESAPSAQVKKRILDAVAKERVARRSTRGLGTGAPGLERRLGWFLPLAASVAIAVVMVTGWLVIEVRDQRLRIAELSSELDRARSTTAALSANQALLAQARSRLAMATSRGAEFCALSPPEGSPASEARGVVVMHETSEEWFLRIEGLAPCPAGRKYVVWFATENGRVPGPVFAPQDGAAVELTITERPEGIRAILITLESEPAPPAPSMEPLLFGNERVQLL